MKDRSLGFTELREMNLPWRDVLHLAVRRECAKNAVITHNEDLLFLQKGRVRLTHNSLGGQEKILWYIAAGCIFGETPFFDSLRATGQSVHICTVPCEIYSFSKECVTEKIIPQRPDLTLNLFASLARKVRMLSNQASSLYVDDVLIRVCKFLAARIILPKSNASGLSNAQSGFTAANAQKAGPLIVLPGISLQEMAGLLGVHRITLYKVFRQQEEMGLFAPYNKCGFEVLRPEEFHRLADA